VVFISEFHDELNRVIYSLVFVLVVGIILMYSLATLTIILLPLGFGAINNGISKDIIRSYLPSTKTEE
jgi:hypothetical protein